MIKTVVPDAIFDFYKTAPAAPYVPTLTPPSPPRYNL